MKQFIKSALASYIISLSLLWPLARPIYAEPTITEKSYKTRRCYPYDKYYLIKKWLPLYAILGAGLFIYVFERKRRDKKETQKQTITKLSKLVDSYEDQLGLNCLTQKERQKAGQEYEEYIARHLRRKGYSINYNGIKKGYDDEGIDLICKKTGEKTLLVQCKNWADDKIIHENYIFEVYGAAKYYSEREKEDVTVSFYATCPLTNQAKIIAVTLGITVYDNFKMLNKD